MASVALIYDLIDDYLALGLSPEQAAEFDTRETIDAVATAIAAAGHSVDRVGNLSSLVARLAQGQRWDLAFNLAEGRFGLARESQVPALLEAYGIPFTFSTPDVLVVCHHKHLTKTVVRAAGLATPDWAVVRRLEDLASDLPISFPAFAKPLAEGSSKGINRHSLVRSTADLHMVCSGLLAKFGQPVLVETYLPGREFTVGLLGEGEGAEIIGILEIGLAATAEAGAYTYENKNLTYRSVLELSLATDATARMAGDLALACWRELGCRDAGRVDIRCDTEGHPCFLEANPLPGLNPPYSNLPVLARQAGLAYDALISRILANAFTRSSTFRLQGDRRGRRYPQQ